MSGYQNLQKYKGSLYGNITSEFGNLEYDYEVPDNIVVASPGGVSSTHHHFPKSLYGQDASSWDIHAGEGYTYPYGEYGNLYSQGEDAGHYMGLYAQPPQDPLVNFGEYTSNESYPKKEFFSPVGSSNSRNGSLPKGGRGVAPDESSSTPIEFIIPPQNTEGINPITGETGSVGSSRDSSLTVSNPWVLFVVVVMAYIASSFWMDGTRKFIIDRFHGGKILSWKYLLLYGVLFTVGILVVSWIAGVPLVKLERI